MRVPEVTALVEAVMAGRVHQDYIQAAGHQYLITTVNESSFYGRCTSTATAAGMSRTVETPPVPRAQSVECRRAPFRHHY